MFKWYKSGIFEKAIPQIRSSGIDLRLSGIVGIDSNITQRPLQILGLRLKKWWFIRKTYLKAQSGRHYRFKTGSYSKAVAEIHCTGRDLNYVV